MATSIEQAVNWRNVTKKPDYQVAARQVDTFVQPQQNTRGEQIAKALGQVSGDLGQAATRKANEAKAAQSKAEEQVSRLERYTASNEASYWTPRIEEYMKTYDFGLKEGKRPTREQAWADFNIAFPDYQDSLNNLQTDIGKTALLEVTGDKFNEFFSKSSIARERLDEENALNNNILNKLQEIDLSSQSVEFTQFMSQIDKDIMSFDRTPQEAYTTLANVASIAARENGDFRVFDYLLGDAQGGKAIGGIKERKGWLEEKNRIKAQLAQQKNQRNTEIADKLKADKVELAKEGAALFNSGFPVTGEQQAALAEKYIELGVPNATSLVKTMGDNFRAMQEVTLTAEQESNIWEGFLAAGTPDLQRDFIQAQVNKGTISQGLMSQLYSRLGNANDKSLLTGSWYTSQSAAITRLTQSTGIMGALVEDDKYSYLKPLFQQRYLQMATTPEWEKLTLDEKYDAMAGLIRAMEELKRTNDDDPTNDMEQLKQIQAPKGVELDELQVQAYNELIEGKTPEQIRALQKQLTDKGYAIPK